MVRKYIIRLFTLALLSHSLVAYSQQADQKQPSNPQDSIKIDQIIIEKNWITWDRIILNELLFTEDEYVRFGQIDTSINKVWNIGNFANVDYHIQETGAGNTMTIEAVDAVKFYPLFTIDHSSENDFKYRLGAGDDNFLGSNAKLKIAWEKTPIAVKWDFSLGLPRQLLYKNMTTRFGFAQGNETMVFLDRVIQEVDGRKTAEYQQLLLAPFDKTEIYAEFGNPWHLDYQYRFSPDLAVRYMDHKINYNLLTDEQMDLGVEAPEQEYQFIDITVSENVGTVNTKRHRKDGYTAGISYDLFQGLRGTGSYHVFNFQGEYHKTFTEVIQLSAWLRSGYTTANDQYRFAKGSSDVLGLRTGEIFGKAYFSSYFGGHFTWLNTKWIALENAYFVNMGNGADSFGSLFGDRPMAAVGSYLEITFPIAPIAVFRFSFMYAGPGSEWFKFNIK